jgi:hypothetical protein
VLRLVKGVIGGSLGEVAGQGEIGAQSWESMMKKSAVHKAATLLF